MHVNAVPSTRGPRETTAPRPTGGGPAAPPQQEPKGPADGTSLGAPEGARTEEGSRLLGGLDSIRPAGPTTPPEPGGGSEPIPGGGVTDPAPKPWDPEGGGGSDPTPGGGVTDPAPKPWDPEGGDSDPADRGRDPWR